VGATPVPANAFSVVVPVIPSLASYTPLANASWGSPVGFPPAFVTPSQFIATFTIPAPADGSGILYTELFPGPVSPVIGGQTTTLQGYLDDLRRILHDPNDRYWPASDKIVYINKGIQKRDIETGINRQLIPFTLTFAKDTYSFSDTGQANVFDVVGINLIFGNVRQVMARFSFTDLNANVRQFKPQLQFYPVAWTRYGPNQVVFAPAPAQAYQTEWDCCVYTLPLVNLTDVDPMPYPYTDPVVFYAAYWAKLNERQWDESAQFLELYKDKLLVANNSRVGTIPTPYTGGVVVVR
jgi:hypothetical protein